MKLFIHLTLIASLFTFNFSYAQLTKGTKSLGINGNSEVYFSDSKSQDNANTLNNQSLNLRGSLGYFLGKNWAVGGSLGFGLGHYKRTSSGINTAQQTRFNGSYNIGSAARYYLKNTAKQGVFLLAEAAYLGGNNQDNSIENGINTSNSSSSDYHFWRFGIGMHQMISEQIAAEGTLYYGRNYSGDNELQLSITPRVFFKTLDKKNAKEAPQYLAKNRWLLDGFLAINGNITRQQLYAYAGVTGGKMLTDRWLVGSNIGISANVYDQNSVSAAPFVRYYIPLTRRLYIFPYLGATFSYAGKKEQSNSNIRLDRGVGYHYFLTRSIALSGTIDGDLEHYTTVATTPQTIDYQSNSGRLGINMGVSYFLK